MAEVTVKDEEPSMEFIINLPDSQPTNQVAGADELFNPSTTEVEGTDKPPSQSTPEELGIKEPQSTAQVAGTDQPLQPSLLSSGKSKSLGHITITDQDSETAVLIKKKIVKVLGEKRDVSPVSCIYRIPQRLKTFAEDMEVYEPQRVHLGPYHNSNERINRTKWHVVYHMLERVNKDLSDFIKIAEDLVGYWRSYYNELGVDKIDDCLLVEVMVRDGIFLLELMEVENEGLKALKYSEDNNFFNIGESKYSTIVDIIKLENQIPLLLLAFFTAVKEQGTYSVSNDKTFVGELMMKMVMDITVKFLGCMTPNKKQRMKEKEEFLKCAPNDPGLHILDVLRDFLLGEIQYEPPNETTDKDKPYLVVTRSASELRKRGVKFKNSESENFMKIQFNNGTLTIPGLHIEGHTFIMFHNLIAYEKYFDDASTHIISFVRFMADLIKSPEDVKHLCDANIIDNFDGSYADVANNFQKLTEGLIDDVYVDYLREERKKLHTYISKRRHSWFATLQLEYLKNPWTIIAVLTAFTLFILTFLQTFYTVYQYHHPP